MQNNCWTLRIKDNLLFLQRCYFIFGTPFAKWGDMGEYKKCLDTFSRNEIIENIFQIWSFLFFRWAEDSKVQKLKENLMPLN